MALLTLLKCFRYAGNLKMMKSQLRSDYIIHMNWNKIFTGTSDHGDHGNEDESETEDDEDVTDSNGTVSTDKKSHFLGMHFHKISHNDLSQRCIKVAFLTVNAAMFFAGMVGIVTSVWSLTDSRIMSRLIGQRFFVTTLVFSSLLASLVSLLGILGLLRRRRKFLNIYALCYLLFLCAIFVSAIMSFWIFEEVTKAIQDDMNTSIESYHSSFSSKEAWDNTHRYCLQMTEAVAYKSGCLRNAVLLLKLYMHTISMGTLLLFAIILVSFILALCILARMRRQSQN